MPHHRDRLNSAGAIVGALLALGSAAAPVMAQIDLTGSWAPDNASDILSNPPGPEPLSVDYLGLPLNDSGQAAALLGSPDKLSMPERICSFYTPVYLSLGPFGLAISNRTEPRNGTTVAWHLGGWEDLAPIDIWMDQRPHPFAHAVHPMAGFTTGVWQDDVLVASTTHMRAGVIRRNSAVHSDRATMTTWYLRHGDELTLFARTEDPVYLAAPLTLTRTFVLVTHGPPLATVGSPCLQGDEGVGEATVPHELPGRNPALNEMTQQYGIPLSAVLGGTETMYPQYRKQIQARYERPEHCPTACGGPSLPQH